MRIVICFREGILSIRRFQADKEKLRNNKISQQTRNVLIDWLVFSVNFNFQWTDDDVRFVLDQGAFLDFYRASSLNSQRINMSPHSDTLPWFEAYQSLLLLLNAACLAEKQQIPILLSLVLPDRGSNSQSTVFEASMPTIIPPMRFGHEMHWWNGNKLQQ